MASFLGGLLSHLLPLALPVSIFNNTVSIFSKSTITQGGGPLPDQRGVRAGLTGHNSREGAATSREGGPWQRRSPPPSQPSARTAGRTGRFGQPSTASQGSTHTDLTPNLTVLNRVPSVQWSMSRQAYLRLNRNKTQNKHNKTKQ